MVGGHYWGTFTIQGGVLYASTLAPRGRIYRIFPGSRSELALESDVGPITGLNFSPAGDLYLTFGTASVYRTRDFGPLERVLHDDSAQFTDVALRH